MVTTLGYQNQHLSSKTFMSLTHSWSEEEPIKVRGLPINV